MVLDLLFAIIVVLALLKGQRAVSFSSSIVEMIPVAVAFALSSNIFNDLQPIVLRGRPRTLDFPNLLQS